MSDHRPAHRLDGVSVPAAGASVPARDRRPVAPRLGGHGDCCRHSRPRRPRFDGCGAGAVRGAGHDTPAPRDAHRLSVPARCGRRRRGGAGRISQGIQLISARTARPGPSRSGSPGFSSMAASIAGRHALRRARWFAPADTASLVEDSRPAFSGSTAPVDPESRLLARERRARLAAADRPPRRPATDHFHVVALRRLHAARSQRHDGPQGIDRARPPVSRRTQAAGLLGGKP